MADMDRRAVLGGGAAGALVSAGIQDASGTPPPWGTMCTIEAGELMVSYADIGPRHGACVLLLHGWPYDILSFADVAPRLADAGYRVIVPHLRGFGGTRLRDPTAPRNGQQAVLARDAVVLMDALGIERATIAGFDWGARIAVCMAALWPHRCRAIVPVSGYLIVNLEANARPLAPEAELGWWYQYYFATERGREGYARNRFEFAKLIWRRASPDWAFDDATFSRSAAALFNPDHVDIVVHNYRWRLGLAAGDPSCDELESALQRRPLISTPAITIGSDFDGASADGAAYRHMFRGPYSHVSLAGVGHNVPQEAPVAFLRAVREAAAL